MANILKVQQYRRLKYKLLDLLYREVCAGHGNEVIQQRLKAQGLPEVTQDQLNELRAYFRENEELQPDKMRAIRERIMQPRQ